jgi:hypothetical protein
MSIKNKNSKTAADKLSTVAMQAGLLLMTLATTLGMTELPDHPNKVVLPNRPAFALASNVTNNAYNNATNNSSAANFRLNQEQPTATTVLRSEREETAPHYITYSTIQRTPSRTGRL